MRFLTPIFTLACFASTSLALNCKGSSECHWTMRHDLMDELVAWIDDERIYAAGERILCTSLPISGQIAFFNWALPKGYCLLAKKKPISGKEIKELYGPLSRFCWTCGSMDTSAGGELTLNHVGDIRKGCKGRDFDTGVYKSGLCGGIHGNL